MYDERNIYIIWKYDKWDKDRKQWIKENRKLKNEKIRHIVSEKIHMDINIEVWSTKRYYINKIGRKQNIECVYIFFILYIYKS